MPEQNNIYHFYTPQDIAKYLAGNMTAQEMHEMERAALSDPLLADAIDGFRKADAATTQQHLNDIKAKILGTEQKHIPVVPLPQAPQKTWWRVLAAACILGITAAGAWWLMQPGSKAISEAPLAKLEVKDTVRASAPAADNTTAIINNDTNTALPAIAAATKQEIPTISEQPNKTVAATKPVQKDIPAILNETKNAELEKESINMAEVADNSSAKITTAPTQQQAMRQVASQQPTNYVSGKITDENGSPLSGVNVTSALTATTTKTDGSFTLPAPNAVTQLNFKATGYNQKSTLVDANTTPIISLSKANAGLDEVVVVGYGMQKKKATIGSINQMKTEKMVAAKDFPYPEDGWAHFYQNMGNQLGVDQKKASKLLQIKFMVDENGNPTDFTIVESPDELLAKKAIEIIKKAKWKNYKLNKNAIVKINVN